MAEKLRSFYKVTLQHEEWADDERTGWLALSDEDIQTIQSFLDQQRQLFLAKYPKDAEDVELWSDWLQDAFIAESANFTVNIGRINPAYLMGIDMNSRCANPPANEIIFN
jgi:hypothetical protein